MATPSKNFRSESVTAAATDPGQSCSIAPGHNDVLIAKILCARKASRSPKGVSGVTTVYGVEVDRWNFVMYNDAFASCSCIHEFIKNGRNGSKDKPDQLCQLPIFP